MGDAPEPNPAGLLHINDDGQIWLKVPQVEDRPERPDDRDNDESVCGRSHKFSRKLSGVVVVSWDPNPGQSGCCC